MEREKEILLLLLICYRVFHLLHDQCIFAAPLVTSTTLFFLSLPFYLLSSLSPTLYVRVAFPFWYRHCSFDAP